MMKLSLPLKLSFPVLGVVFLTITLLVMLQTSYQVPEIIRPMSVTPTDEPILAPKPLTKEPMLAPKRLTKDADSAVKTFGLR
ncbi:MAG: hypothetical protein WCA07_02475 [Gloeobacterales cyanobacterium]